MGKGMAGAFTLCWKGKFRAQDRRESSYHLWRSAGLRVGRTGCLRRIHAHMHLVFFFFFLSLFFLLFRAAPAGYGGSQARGQIGATATAQATATVMPDLSLVCNLYRSSWQRWILNPLSEAKHRTHNLMVASWICFCCTTTGTLSLFLFKHFCAWFVLKLLQSIRESHCPLVLAIVIFYVKKKSENWSPASDHVYQ